MARTAPAPNVPPIPGMCPSIAVMGGGAGGGGGSGNASGDGSGNGDGSGDGSGDGANGDGRNAQSGNGQSGGQAGCPNHHGGSSGGASRGDPVDVVTGRVFTLPVTDLELKGPLPLELLRAYSSGSRDRDIGLGYGWAHSLGWTVETTRSRFRVYKWDGTAVDFPAFDDELCGYGPNGWILGKAQGRFSLLLEDRTQLRFEPTAPNLHVLVSVADRFGNTIRLFYSNGKLSEVEDCVGRRIRVARDEAGRIRAFEVMNAVSQGAWIRFAEYAYDSAGDLVAVTDALGYTTTFAYESHRMTMHKSPTGLTYHYRYDGQGRCIETWGDYGGKDDPALVEDAPRFLADGATRAKGIYHVRLDFGADGYREIVDSVTVDRVFGNAHGKMDKCVRAGGVFARTYDDNGNLLSFTDSAGATTRFKRDEFGRIIETIDPLDRITRTERDDRGNVLRVIDALGGVTETTSFPDGLAWTDPSGARFFIRHDQRGLMTEAHAPNGGVSRYAYDAHGNPIREIDRSGVVTERTFDFFGRVLAVKRAGAETHYTYDARGDIARQTMPDGSAVHFRYDGDRYLVGITRANNRTVELLRGGDHRVHTVRYPDGSTTRYLWDREQRLRKVVNAAGETWTFELNAAGRLVRETTFDGRTIAYQYDAAGNLSCVRDGSRTLALEHDLAGQLVKRSVRGIEEEFEYDALGRLTRAKRNRVELAFAYNAVGWPTTQRCKVGDEVTEVCLDWDVMGDVVEQRTSLGHALSVTRDAIGRAVSYAAPGLELRRSYDGFHREVFRELGGGGTVETVRDVMERQTRRVVRDAGGKVTATESWGYGPRGELAMVQSQRSGAVHFEHDPNDRLIAAVGEDVARFFDYDAAGNRAERGRGAHRFGPGGKILQKGDRTYGWDAWGRLTSVSRMADGKEEQTRLEWCEDGLLRSVLRPDGVLVEFEYDAFRRRVSKRVRKDGRLQADHRFVWDRSKLVHAIKRDAAQAGDPVVEETTFAYDDDDGAPLAQRTVRRRAEADQDLGWRHLLNDPLGTPQHLVESGGVVSDDTRIDIWGAAPSGDGLRLAGQYHDEETGLSYNRFRYYDPDLGAFLSPDPLGLFGGLEPYGYVANQPTRAVDPMGLMPRTTIVRPNGQEVRGTSAGTDRSGRPRTNDPAIATAVENARTSGAGSVPTNSHGNCAEVDALHNLANTIRNERAAAGQTLRDPEAENQAIRQQVHDEVQAGRMSTVDDDGSPMNPCTSCGQILRELGLHPKSPHYEPRNRRSGVQGRDGQWNGRDCQQGSNRHTRDRSVPGRTPPFVE
ncbi:MAG: RHS repeat protein [Myxococcales bacterium]|nr:RHS repeat protein [Myxococcales bacterium]